ncbi:uncharacterized protein SPAPADRAFT_54347 [Spathaspora passalidarum NRRL Y-27907]|uniref:Uncharacterized protein n=1 Tax=Spathaspora passalidarum (strain NRRL Y-27907 / 11-Y1) TaxID=619300 RepID=G3AHJ9_SPAPN|nr:uncharacterized protein SPAPADRAFT_54347 [Spathaspora passalidarum NRRL Y-27907]EGW34163.1 hypothetical protein SPAPADRAFT_54347 [Spathaspora passalidarum NRRL Y-27907]
MAQGKIKLKAKAPARVTKKQQNPKRNAPKIIKPKKTVAKEAKKLTKVHQSQLMTSTEKLIASRVGHLELIKGSRREIEKEQKAADKNNAANKEKLEPTLAIPELTALDPDLVLEKEKKERKSRRRIR